MWRHLKEFKTYKAALLAIALGVFLIPFRSAIPQSRGGNPTVPTVPNVVKLSDADGTIHNNYPVQIGRPFLLGEILHFPRVLADSVPLPTQADVKNRYADGSVKFAILSFIVPTIAAHGSVALTFQDQSSGDNTPMSAADMAGMDFDATIVLTENGNTQQASAAAMLQNGDFTYWTQGPIATTIILADHAGRKYDMGFDQYRPFRPIFHATFWPALNKIRVRFIGEISNSEELEDVVVTDLKLLAGKSSPSVVYQLPAAKSPLTMIAASRWTKEAWIGGAPDSQVNVDNNLPYLALTKFVPNFDTSISLPQSVIGSQYTAWNSAKQDLYDAGIWTKAMATVGARGDIGPYTLWVTNWLFSADHRTAEIAMKMADLAAAWPMHIREGNAAKSLSGLGRTLAVSSRPTICLYTAALFNYSYTTVVDKVKVVGNMTSGGWTADGAHQPDAYSVPYTLTGDYWYLEQMQLWAGFSAARYNGAANTASSGRGPTGSEGGVHDEVRGDGWVMRNRAEAAFLTPDDEPEKAYFAILVNDALATWEGERRIHGTIFEGSPSWNWGFKEGQQDAQGTWSVVINGSWHSIGPPALNFWQNNTSITGFNDGTNNIKVGGGISEWMQYYLIYSLGRVKELGFASDALLQWSGTNLVGQLTDSTYNPYLVGAYQTPVMKSDGSYFMNWGEVKDGFPQSLRDVTTWPSSAYPTVADGYTFYAMAAAAMITRLPRGQDAWSKLRQMIGANLSVLTNDPRLAILPRVTQPGRTPSRR